MNKVVIYLKSYMLLFLTLTIFITCPLTASAEQRTIEADGTYLVGDGPDENHSVAKARARIEAKRHAAEQAAVLIESISAERNGHLTVDEIKTLSSQVLQIINEKITPEVQGEAILYRCHIVALVDSSNVMTKMTADRKKLEEAVQKNKQQEKELAAVKAELAQLKAIYKTSSTAERQEINRKVKNNEKRFTAAEWIAKGDEYYANSWNNSYYKKKTIECYHKAVEADPKYATAWYTLGEAYQRWLLVDGDARTLDKISLKYIRKAIELDPEYALAWNSLGYIYKSMQNYKKALECFNKAAELEPQEGFYWLSIGNFYYWSPNINLKKAIVNYSKATEAYNRTDKKNLSKEAEAWKFLGYSYYLLGDYKKTIEVWDIAKAKAKAASIPYFWDLECQEAYAKARKALNQR